MLKVGLTGGIGAGKTVASDYFEKLGVPVIDTDVIARELVTPGSPALQDIIAAFGKSVLTDRNELDRKSLGREVFSDPSKKAQLESILHPRIKREALRRVQQCDAPYCVLVIPLLIETDFVDLVDKVLVIDAPASKRVDWVTRRDGLSQSEVNKRLDAQTSRQERLARADYVIVNDGSISDLEANVLRLHEQILQSTA